ncbi:Phosphatidylinositolglycan class N-domain-containing protein [Entophlyctis helioformis]|nr:Phosphatidylinositolglycan class N-domain-containing protein [Entophlyctis helioformis]
MGSVANLLVFGIIFHAIYSWSIFDIYFRSPLVHGMTPVDPPGPAPAKRLVLVVGDGLRADKLFEGRMDRAPFLLGKVLDQGSWGVSHTRVPTESRPGHVALIAGFYEDVSAVTKGWKMNPVNFDSLFNESRHTWSFGSPDILPMFAYGASDPSRIDMFMYEAESEDFAKDDASLLDTWVFDHLDSLLESSKTNSTLSALLHSDKIVIFLHLLGLDTNGHGHKPNSQEYFDNIRLVDEGIKRVERTLANFYGDDGKTAFIFSADHGMGNRGAHGDGHPDNTQTPIIAWGAGIAKPNRSHPTGHDDLSAPWNLADVQRKDVNQADIAPLMSSLIGVPYPLNSVGVLPIDYLANTDEYKALAAFGNAKQILAQYITKASIKRRTELFFKPFQPLVLHNKITERIQHLIAQDDYEAAERESTLLIQLCIEGLRYYQTYDWLFLRSIISFGYIGWIVYSTIFIVRTYVPEDVKRAKGIPISATMVNSLGLSVLAGLSIMLYLKESPAAYYLYVASFKQRELVTSIIRTPWSQSRLSVVGNIVIYVAVLEVLVYTYFRREVLTACLLVAGQLWPMSMPKLFRERHRTLVIFWRLATVATSVFTVLPIDVDENVLLVILGGFCVLLSGFAALYLIPKYTASQLPVTRSRAAEAKTQSLTVIVVQLVILAVSFVVLYTTSVSLKAKTGLPLLNSIISWCTLGAAILIPTLDSVSGTQHYLRRLVIIYLSFAPLFLLLSTCYETLFFFCFSITILSWMLLEKQLYYYDNKIYRGDNYAEVVRDDKDNKNRSLTVTDTRIASFFLLFINVAFFGTGNIASVSSFSMSSVYRFTTVFNPFLMGALLVLKILIPFFLLSLFLLVLSTTDIMTLNFFFLVRDDGSWLEIGTTISHFIIASAFIVFQIILFCVSHVLVGKVLIPRGVNSKKTK